MLKEAAKKGYAVFFFGMHATMQERSPLLMKLAEALQARSDLNTRIAQLRVRILNNALVQEGESPAEKPDDLIKQLNACISELEDLIARINLTNSTASVDGKTLTEWIAARDVLTVKLEIYRNLVNEASSMVSRARGTEIRIKPTVRVASLQKQVDQMSRDLRLINNRIQSANWTVDLN